MIKNKMIVAIALATTLGSSVVASGKEINLDDLNRAAYDAVMSAEKEGTQLSVNTARETILALKEAKPDSEHILGIVNNYSSYLDKVQNKILSIAIKSIEKARETVAQDDINEAIDNLPIDMMDLDGTSAGNKEFWRNKLRSMSTAIDEVQVKLQGKLVNLLEEVEIDYIQEKYDGLLALRDEVYTSKKEAIRVWVENNINPRIDAITVIDKEEKELIDTILAIEFAGQLDKIFYGNDNFTQYKSINKQYYLKALNNNRDKIKTIEDIQILIIDNGNKLAVANNGGVPNQTEEEKVADIKTAKNEVEFAIKMKKYGIKKVNETWNTQYFALLNSFTTISDLQTKVNNINDTEIDKQIVAIINKSLDLNLINETIALVNNYYTSTNLGDKINALNIQYQVATVANSSDAIIMLNELKILSNQVNNKKLFDYEIVKVAFKEVYFAELSTNKKTTVEDIVSSIITINDIKVDEIIPVGGITSENIETTLTELSNIGVEVEIGNTELYKANIAEINVEVNEIPTGSSKLEVIEANVKRVNALNKIVDTTTTVGEKETALISYRNETEKVIVTGKNNPLAGISDNVIADLAILLNEPASAKILAITTLIDLDAKIVELKEKQITLINSINASLDVQAPIRKFGYEIDYDKFLLVNDESMVRKNFFMNLSTPHLEGFEVKLQTLEGGQYPTITEEVVVTEHFSEVKINLGQQVELTKIDEKGETITISTRTYEGNTVETELYSNFRATSLRPINIAENKKQIAIGEFFKTLSKIKTASVDRDGVTTNITDFNQKILEVETGDVITVTGIDTAYNTNTTYSITINETDMNINSYKSIKNYLRYSDDSGMYIDVSKYFTDSSKVKVNGSSLQPTESLNAIRLYEDYNTITEEGNKNIIKTVYGSNTPNPNEIKHYAVIYKNIQEGALSLFGHEDVNLSKEFTDLTNFKLDYTQPDVILDMKNIDPSRFNFQGNKYAKIHANQSNGAERYELILEKRLVETEFNNIMTNLNKILNHQFTLVDAEKVLDYYVEKNIEPSGLEQDGSLLEERDGFESFTEILGII